MAPTRPHVHREHGVERDDAYAWMSEIADPDLLAYLRSERAYYDAVTAPLASLRDDIVRELRGAVPTDEIGAAWTQDGWEYRWERRGSAEHSRLVRRRVSDDDPGEWRVLLDQDALVGPDGYVELGVVQVSPSGTVLAYSVDSSGDELFELRFRDLMTGVDRDDVVTGVHHGGAWAADSATFLYVVPDTAWRAAEIRRYQLGQAGMPVRADAGDLVLTEPDESFSLSVRLTRSRRLLVLTASSSDCTEVLTVPADDPSAQPASVGGRRAGIEYHVEHAPAGPAGVEHLLVVTNDEVPEFRLVSSPTDGPGPQAWVEAVPPRNGERLLGVDAFAAHLVLSLRKGGAPTLRIIPRDDMAAAWDLDASAAGELSVARNPDYAATALRVHEEGTTLPATQYDVDLASGERTLVHRQDVVGFDPDRYLAERRWLPARDGVEIPVVLARHRTTPLDGSAPCVLYGYGAYEAILDPWFDSATVSLLDRGVVHVLASVRGGGEVGRAWWEQGRLTAKPTSWHDLVDVADALADEPLVDGDRIAIHGVSAGGLLVAGAMQERPHRFVAVVAEVPFVDVVTTMLDESLPLTTLEWREWGDPRDPDGFSSLMSWSPYDNTVEMQARPAMLVTGALHDTRVRVTEPAKWVAKMRALDAEAGRDPSRLVFRAETAEGSHGGPSGRFARLDYDAEVVAWTLDALRSGRRDARRSGAA
jgi:oligopeptidase B